MRRRPLCLVAVFLLLILWILPKDVWYEKPDIPSGKEMILTGIVSKREQKKDKTVYYLKKCLNEQTGSKFSVCAYTPKGDSHPVGCELSLYGTIYQVNEADNPGQFDARDYYQSQGILYTFQAKTVISAKGKGIVKDSLTNFKEFFGGKLDELFSARDAGILKAALLGDDASILEADELLYQKSGISHLLAISGLHISLIGISLYRFLRKCRLNFWEAGIPSGILLYLYGMMTGFGISTIRAVCMFVVMIFADILGRAYDMASGAALAAIIILIRNPLQARSAGFLLSFGAVFGICCVYKILCSVILCEKKWTQSLGISLSIALVTYPVSVHFFYEYPMYGALLNLIVIPAMPFVMGFGAVAMIIGCFMPAVGRMLGIPAHLILSLYEFLGECTLKLPLSVARIGCEEPWQLTAYYGMLMLALLGVWYGRRLIYTAIIPAALLIITLRFSPDFQFTMLDVGQGDGMYLRMPDATVCCIDGGSANVKNVGKYRLLPYLKYEGVSTVDVWVVTHLDEDHISGVREILEMYESFDGVKIKTMLFPDIRNPDEVYEELWTRARECGISVDTIGKGELLQGENWTLTCLSPEKRKFANDKNESSVVLQLEFGELSMLFTGDCGFETEERLVRKAMLTPVDVWKVSHHGSKYSGSERFLKEIDPQLSLISVGKNNYGHPNPDLLKRLEKAGSFVETTLENGALTLESDGEHYTLSLQRGGD